MREHLVSGVLILPALFSLIITFAGGSNANTHRIITLVGTVLTFLFSIGMLLQFDPTQSGMQLVDSHSWIETFNIRYIVGIDGFSLSLILLTTLLFVIAVVAACNTSKLSFEKGSKGFFALILLLESTLLGTFSALDLFLYFSFWMASILPIYFLVGVWGGEQRENASNRFFLYQLFGSVLTLFAVIIIYYIGDLRNLNLMELSGGKFAEAKILFGDHSWSVENLVYLIFLAGFAVRTGLFPFHSWLPRLLESAPPVLSALIVGVFIKTGVYALFRINYQLFPGASAWTAKAIAILSAVNIIYGALCAIAQKDIRKIGAYGTIAHMGFVLLGLAIQTATSLHGAVLLILAHGIFAGMFFLLIGILGSERNTFLLFDDQQRPVFGGLVTKTPILTVFFSVTIFSMLGVPGVGGFVGSSLVFLGGFPVYRAVTVTAIIGLFLSSGYLLWMYRHIFLGKETESNPRDMSFREQMYLIPLVFLSIFIGTYPAPFIHLSQTSVEHVLGILQKR